MKNNTYLICNNNEFNHILIPNMLLLVNDINQSQINKVSFDKSSKRINIDDFYIDIDDEHVEIVEECVKMENITLSVMSNDGDILSMYQIH
jgi:hypothetical protein